jgi:outer membrane protein OmpA-like peptidoglycan-associated protein
VIKRFGTVALAATLVAGCASQGGGTGGGVMGTDTGKGALFGAAAGALAGGLIGHHMDTQKQNLAQVLAPEVSAGHASVELLKNQGVLVNMTGNTRFAPGSAVVNPAFLGALQKVASVAKTYGKITITVIGHPDKGGTEADRQRLSSQRAEAVRLQLIGMGVPSILVSASGNPRSTWDDGRVELVIHPVIGG